ncbi:MAG: HugZ family protein [Isosphaeraceae bacterium]
MPPDELRLLVPLIRDRRVAALGTLRDGEPLVSQVVYAPEADLCGFLILASGLAQHTQDFRKDPRVGLMVAEAETPGLDSLSLARVSLRGTIAEVTGAGYDEAKSVYLEANPGSLMLFTLGDFALYRFTPRVARFVAGFGRSYDLNPDHLRQAAGLTSR